MKALLLSKGTSNFICKPVSSAYRTVVDTVRLSRLGLGGGGLFSLLAMWLPSLLRREIKLTARIKVGPDSETQRSESPVSQGHKGKSLGPLLCEHSRS